jgi:hypothetical protein
VFALTLRQPAFVMATALCADKSLAFPISSILIEEYFYDIKIHCFYSCLFELQLGVSPVVVYYNDNTQIARHTKNTQSSNRIQPTNVYK